MNGTALDPTFIAEVCKQLETDAFGGFDPARFPTTSLLAMAPECLACDEAGHLRVHTDPEGFDRFVDSCLA